MSKTWDIFSLSSIYINIIFSLKTQSTNCKFLDHFLKFLLLNTHPNFEKRKNISDTIELFDKICIEQMIHVDIKQMLDDLSTDSLIKVNKYLYLCNNAISSSFDLRMKLEI